jgi:2-polyprenyl-3-methyl-5-hydroxy-6-metoxy-1,4-benzoquinol methylase
MAERAWFWDRLATRYARMPIADPASYAIKLARTRQFFTPDSRVLEFGCGTGSTAIAHAPHVAHIAGIDYSARMIEIARQRAAEAGAQNVRFDQATLAEFDSPPASWDVVMGMSILHLLPDRGETLARVHALLKPGGVFISSTICLGDGPRWTRLLAPVMRSLPRLPDIAVLSQAQLAAEMEAAGLTLEHQWCPGPNRASFMIARKPPRMNA